MDIVPGHHDTDHSPDKLVLQLSLVDHVLCVSNTESRPILFQVYHNPT